MCEVSLTVLKTGVIMFNWLRRRALILDLDEPDASQIVLEHIDDPQPPESSWHYSFEGCTLWLKALLYHSLDSGALAIHLMRDSKDNCLRVLIYCPSQDDARSCDGWHELVPAPGWIMNQAIRTLRKTTGMRWGSKQGRLRFKSKGLAREGCCVQRGVIDYAIYFTQEHPRLLKKDLDEFG